MHDIAQKRSVILRTVAAVAMGTGLAFALVSEAWSANHPPRRGSGSEDWDDWRPLGVGFAGRRRMPPPPEVNRAQQIVNAEATARLGLLARNRAVGLWLRTKEEGLYKLGVADLAAQIGLPETTVRDWLAQGRWLALKNAGVTQSWYFDAATDAVYFVGRAYETFYTDTNAYHLVFGQPKIMTKVTGPSPAPGVPGSAFRDTLKFEQEPAGYNLQWVVRDDADADFWFWGYLYPPYVATLSVTLEVPNAAPSGQAQIRIRLRGASDLEAGNDHRVSAQLNGVPVGSAVEWDGFGEAVLTATFDQSLFQPSGSNVLTLTGAQLGLNPAIEFLDDVELDYWREPYALNGRLWLHGLTAGVHTVGGFSEADIRVIEAPGTRRARWRSDVSVTPSGDGKWQVTFSAPSRADYLVVQGSAIGNPVVAADVPSYLRRWNNAADYLIIAPRQLAQTAESLRSHRSQRYPLASIVWLEDIYDEFSYGRVDPHAIWAFLSHARRVWHQPPQFVVLLGKGTVDHKNRLAYHDSLVPVLMALTPWGLAASDNRYMDADGDDVADFAYGRIPVKDEAAGLAYVSKLMAYEAAPNASRRAVVAADNPDSAGDFHANAEALTAQLANLGYGNVTRLYHCVTPEQQAAHPGACADVRAGLTSSSTWDSAYISYDGHGSATQIGNGSENFLKVADVPALGNTALPVFTALTCAVGDDTHPGWDALAGALVRKSAGGAIASLAPTGLSYDLDAHALGTRFVDEFLGARLTIGDALMRAQAASAGHVNDFMLRIYEVIGDPAVQGR